MSNTKPHIFADLCGATSDPNSQMPHLETSYLGIIFLLLVDEICESIPRKMLLVNSLTLHSRKSQRGFPLGYLIQKCLRHRRLSSLPSTTLRPTFQPTRPTSGSRTPSAGPRSPRRRRPVGLVSTRPRSTRLGTGHSARQLRAALAGA